MALVLAIVPFIGIERKPGEHATSHLPFVKQAPSLTFVFSNGALCGECDLFPLERLSPERHAEFAAFCEARYGLEPRPCHAIYAEQQRMLNE